MRAERTPNTLAARLSCSLRNTSANFHGLWRLEIYRRASMIVESTRKKAAPLSLPKHQCALVFGLRQGRFERVERSGPILECFEVAPFIRVKLVQRA